MITKSYEETIELGKKIGRLLPQGVIILNGKLGAGKTTLTKGMALGLEIDEIVNSPTFVIMKEYIGKVNTLYHFDFYRITGDSLDYDLLDYLEGNHLTVIEWASNQPGFLPKEYLEITLDYLDVTTRKISFNPRGKKYEMVVKQI